jgi:hypothetical protein
VTIAFIRAQTALDAARPMLVDQLRADASLWIAWPRKAAGHLSDLTDNRVRESLLPTGLVDIKVAALDHDWSGLKFVWRKELRPSA